MSYPEAYKPMGTQPSRTVTAVADPGGRADGAMPLPSPVEISNNKDGHQRWPHRFHVSCPPLSLPGRWTRCWTVM